MNMNSKDIEKVVCDSVYDSVSTSMWDFVRSSVSNTVEISVADKCKEYDF